MPSTALTFASNTSLSNTDDGRISRLEAALPRVVSGAPLTSTSAVTVPAASAVLPSGLISPSTGIAATGNVFTFVVQGQFGFTSTATTITIYWDGTNGSVPFVIRRADGSQFSVPSGSLIITGLTAGQVKYGFGPFIAVAQPDHVSFALGDSGSPRYALSPSAPADLLSQASQTQRLNVNESITSGLIYFQTAVAATTVTGTGSGGYTGNPGFDPNHE